MLSLCLALGTTMVAFDFSGSGKSEGAQVTMGHNEAGDLEVVLYHLLENKEISEFVLWGRGMGAATALMYESKTSALSNCSCGPDPLMKRRSKKSREPSIRALILDSPFADLKHLIDDMVSRSRRQQPLKILGKVNSRRVKRCVQTKAGFNVESISPVTSARSCFLPAAFVAPNKGGNDARRIHDYYAGEKSMLTIEADTSRATCPPLLCHFIVTFLRKHLSDVAPIEATRQVNPSELPWENQGHLSNPTLEHQLMASSQEVDYQGQQGQSQYDIISSCIDKSIEAQKLIRSGESQAASTSFAYEATGFDFESSNQIETDISSLANGSSATYGTGTLLPPAHNRHSMDHLAGVNQSAASPRPSSRTRGMRHSMSHFGDRDYSPSSSYRRRSHSGSGGSRYRRGRHRRGRHRRESFRASRSMSPRPSMKEGAGMDYEGYLSEENGNSDEMEDEADYRPSSPCSKSRKRLVQSCSSPRRMYTDGGDENSSDSETDDFDEKDMPKDSEKFQLVRDSEDEVRMGSLAETLSQDSPSQDGGSIVGGGGDGASVGGNSRASRASYTSRASRASRGSISRRGYGGSDLHSRGSRRSIPKRNYRQDMPFSDTDEESLTDDSMDHQSTRDELQRMVQMENEKLLLKTMQSLVRMVHPMFQQQPQQAGGSGVSPSDLAGGEMVKTEADEDLLSEETDVLPMLKDVEKTVGADGVALLNIGGKTYTYEELMTSMASMAAYEQQVEMLKSQLQSSGVKPIEDTVALDEAKDLLKAALRRLFDGDDKAQDDFDKWDTYIRFHPEHIKQENNWKAEWLERNHSKNCAAADELRGVIPSDIYSSSLEGLIAKGLDTKIAKRVWENKVLWWCRSTPDRIAKTHEADLKIKYSISGLDLRELRAVFSMCPSQFENDLNGAKKAFLDGLLEKLKELVALEDAGKLSPAQKLHPVYARQKEPLFDPKEAAVAPSLVRSEAFDPTPLPSFRVNPNSEGGDDITFVEEKRRTAPASAAKKRNDKADASKLIGGFFADLGNSRGCKERSLASIQMDHKIKIIT